MKAYLIAILLTVTSFDGHSMGSPKPPTDSNGVQWNFLTKKYPQMDLNYTSIFVDGNTIKFFSGGGGTDAGNGLRETTGTFSKPTSAKTIINTGPDVNELNYFRGVSSARARTKNSNRYEHWIISEVSRCYTGCNTDGRIFKMAVYRSVDSAETWQFEGLMTVDGQEYSQWGANDALIFDPTKSQSVVDTEDPTNNRFIMWGNKSSGSTAATVLVSADGVNFKTSAITYPIVEDNPVFVSLAKTPHGYHMMAGANWTAKIGTTTVRHLFSKDLKSWKTLELQSAMKNKSFYKGVHLKYEPATNQLWAFSGCGKNSSCGYLANLTPKDF